MNLFELFVKIGVDDQASGKLSKLSSSLGKGLQTAAKVGVAAVGAASTAIAALGKIGFDYNKQIETYTTNFEVMMGDAEAAARKVEELKEMGARTPFELGDLANATQTLLAFNVSADDSTGVLSKLGDISLGNVQKLESLTRAYGKMNASQKVTLEDINMMIDAGFNPLLIVAENTGETMEQVYDRISKGGVSFNEITAAIDQATSAGGQFYQGMEKASQTTEGLISTLKDNATALVGEVFMPISEGIAQDVLPSAIDAINKLSDAFREDGINGMIEAAGEIIGNTLGTFTSNLPKFVSTAVDIIGSLLNGIRSNLGAIVQGAFETVDTLIDGIIDMLPELISTGVLLIGKLAVGVIKAIPELVSKIPQIISAVVRGFSDGASEFLGIGRNIVNGVWSGIQGMWSTFYYNVKSFFSNIVSSVKSVLGIRSPSRVFRDQIGKQMAAGVGVGFEDEFSRVKDDIDDALNFDDASIGINTSIHKVGAGYAGGAFGGTSIGNITINIDGAKYSDENALADAIAERLQMMTDRRSAVYA